MEVTLLRSTPDPEQLVCQAARGDYYEGFIGDTDFDELMEPVSYDEHHEEYALDALASVPMAKSVGYADTIEDLETSDYQAWAEREAKKAALVQRLFDRGHFGPFEHPQATFAIEGVSRSCMAQITRHRHASFDVQSQRYADFSSKEDPVVTPASITDEDHFTRETGVVEFDDIDRDDVAESFDDLAEECFDWYERMVEHGMPKEDARFLLPIGTKVNMSVSMNARALMHVFDMRKKPDAQWEIRQVSDRMFELFRDWMPITAELYDESAPHKLKP